MIKKLIKHSNIAVVEETIIKKISENPESQKAFEEIIKQYGPVFKKLAKH